MPSFKLPDNIDDAIYEKNRRERIVHILQLLHENRDKATEEMVNDLRERYHFRTIQAEEDSECYIYDSGIYQPKAFVTIDEYIRNILGQAYKPVLVRAVLAKIKADTYIAEEDFDEKNPQLLCLQNGILDIGKKELLPHSALHYFKNKIPVRYTPGADCPNFKTFLAGIMNEEDISAFQEFFGYCLWRSYPYAKALMLLGGGSNGKSTLIQVMKNTIGIENCKSMPLKEICEESFAISELKGIMLNNCGDNGGVPIDDVSRFKDLTGGESVTANRKNLPRITFVPFAKYVFSYNELPRFKDQSDGNFRRWMLIEFTQKYYTKKEYALLTDKEKAAAKIADPELISKVLATEERPGIFNFALEGLDRLFKQGGFSYGKTTAQVRDTMVNKADPYTAFCKNMIVEQSESVITRNELRDAYELYLKEQSINGHKNLGVLYRIIESKFNCSQTTSHGNIRGFVGIAIKKHEETLLSSNKITDGTDGTLLSIWLEERERHSRHSSGVPPVTPVPNDEIIESDFTASDDEICVFLKRNGQVSRFVFCEKYGEDRYFSLMKKGIIFEPVSNQVRVLE